VTAVDSPVGLSGLSQPADCLAVNPGAPPERWRRRGRPQGGVPHEPGAGGRPAAHNRPAQRRAKDSTLHTAGEQAAQRARSSLLQPALNLLSPHLRVQYTKVLCHDVKYASAVGCIVVCSLAQAVDRREWHDEADKTPIDRGTKLWPAGTSWHQPPRHREMGSRLQQARLKPRQLASG
jgi:hypothetical protein